LVEDIAGHKSSHGRREQVGQGVFEGPVALLGAVGVHISQVLPHYLGQSDSRVEDSTRYPLKTGVKTNPSEDNAHDHRERIFPPFVNFIFTGEESHYEKHPSQSLRKEHLAICGETICELDNFREKGVLVGDEMESSWNEGVGYGHS